MKLFNETMDLIEKSMDLHFKRHMLLSSNIANSETPNFKAKELDFAGELQKVLDPNNETLEKTSPLHMDVTSAAGSHIVTDNTGAMGADGNNVDLDVSMGKLADNSREYGNAVSWLGVQLRMLKNAARGRVA